MQLTSLFKMLLVGFFAFACLLEGSNAVFGGLTRRGTQKMKAVQKGIGETFSGAAGSGVSAVSSSAATSSSGPVTIKIEVKTKTSIEFSCSTTRATTKPTATAATSSNTADQTRALASITSKLSQKGHQLKTLRNEFTTRRAAHQASLQTKLTAINTTLSDIATVMASTETDLKFLQRLFFTRTSTKDANTNPKNKDKNQNNNKTKTKTTTHVNLSKQNVEKMLAYLKVRAGDNQQINFSAVVKSTQGVLNMVREMEKEIGKWDAYVVGFEKEVQEIGLEVEELKGEVEGLVDMAGAKVEVAEENQVQDPVGSISGVLVRVKGWLNGEGEAEGKDEEEQKTELKYVFGVSSSSFCSTLVCESVQMLIFGEQVLKNL